MSLERRLSIVTLAVSDLDVSTEFYRRLGWSRSAASNSSITFIRLKGTVLALYGREALAEDAGIEDSKPGFSGVTLAYNVPSEIGVDAVVKFAVSCGATLVKAAEKVAWGGYSAYVSDPDGHLWEIAYNPFFPQDEQGHLVLPE